MSHLLVLAFPLVTAVALASGRARAAAVTVAPWAAVPALLFAFGSARPVVVDVPWLVLGTRLGLDATGRVFLIVAALLWTVCGVYAVQSPGQVSARARFLAFFLLSLAGNIGVMLAADVVTFYAWFSVMSFSSCGLVMHDRRGEVSRAGRVYVGFIALGEALLFVGIVGLASAQGDTAFPAAGDWARVPPSAAIWFGFAVAGFGVKMGAVPLHMWAPLAYRAAPIPAAAALSGPMLLAGLLGWLRFLPLGTVSLTALGSLLVAGGFVSAFWGVCAGLAQRDPRALLGYSSVSQMGIVSTAVGAGLLVPDGWPLMLPSVWFFAVHHALAKTALVLGIAEVSRGATGGRRGAMAAVAFLAPALALAGVPFSSGAAAKTALKHTLDMLPVSSGDAAGWLLSAASTGTTLLMLRYLALGWPRRQNRSSATPSAPWVVLVAIVLVWVWLPLSTGLRSAALEIVAPAQVWSTFWPPALAVVIAWAAWRSDALRARLLSVRVPPGDIIVPIERAARMALVAGGRLAARLSAPLQVGPHPDRTLTRVLGSRSRAAEAVLQRWDVAGILILALLLAVAGLLAAALD